MAAPARRSQNPKKQQSAPSQKHQRRVWKIPRWLLLSIRAALTLFAFCALYPVRYHAADTTLDPSWAVALNQFHVRGLMHGRDIGFTYGPLAYLTLPMPFGTNLEQGVAF